MTTQQTIDGRISNLEDAMGKLIDLVGALGKKLETVQVAAAPKKQIFGEHRGRVAIKDTKTGITYPSQAAVTKAIGPEFGVDPLDHFGCYKIFSKAPDRFIRLDGTEAQKVWDAADAANQAKVDAANAKIAADAAKNAVSAGAGAAAPAAHAAADAAHAQSDADKAIQAAKDALLAKKNPPKK
jgi:hypothetical protein